MGLEKVLKKGVMPMRAKKSFQNTEIARQTKTEIKKTLNYKYMVNQVKSKPKNKKSSRN